MRRMIERVLPRAACLFLLWAIASAADVTGLRQQSEVKITAQMTGAPFEGDNPPYIWAISFSPDGKSLAFGVQFARKKKERSFHSYLLVVSADQPSVVLRKFETPTQAVSRNTIVWSSDSKFLAVTPWGDWDHAAVVDLDAGQLHVFLDRVGVSSCFGATGLLPGPRFVQRCTVKGSLDTAVRFLGIDGIVAQQWIFSGYVNLLHISPDGKMLALDFPGPADQFPLLRPHDIVLFNIADRTETRRWSLPEARVYDGTFAKSGKAFCTVADPRSVGFEHEIVCREIATGAVISKKIVPRGLVRMGATGNKLILSHLGIVVLPFPLFGVKYFFTHWDQIVSDQQTGQTIAQWRMPKYDTAFESAVSENGEMVAIVESGILRVYRVGQ